MKSTLTLLTSVLALGICLVGLRTPEVPSQHITDASPSHVEFIPNAKSSAVDVHTMRVSLLSDEEIETVKGPRISDRFPNIDLIDHRGRNLKFYDDLVEDRAVCIVFFYTRCTGSCPGTTVTLKHLREGLKDEFHGEEMTFISLTLEPDVDTPEELQEYMARYGIKDDPNLPEWIYATGNYEELDGLRRSLGVYDLDPIIDADKTEHAAILTFGNDRTDRWAALPTGLKKSYLVDTIIRITGNSERQRYASVLVNNAPNAAKACEMTSGSCCEKQTESVPACCKSE